MRHGVGQHFLPYGQFQVSGNVGLCRETRGTPVLETPTIDFFLDAFFIEGMSGKTQISAGFSGKNLIFELQPVVGLQCFPTISKMAGIGR